MGHKMSPCCKTVQYVKNHWPLMVSANVILMLFLGNVIHPQYTSTITITVIILVHGQGTQFKWCSML